MSRHLEDNANVIGDKQKKKEKTMKQLFAIGVITTLMTACVSTTNEFEIITPTDSVSVDSTHMYCHMGDTLVTDSINNVSDLLDTLANYEPAAKMTH